VRRLLTIVPYIVQHPGVEMADLCDAFGVSMRDLQEDLTRLFMTGVPPYTPDALVDVDMQGERVTITFAEHFARPLHLTREEGLSLYLRAKALAATPGVPGSTALASALGKLKGQLGASAAHVAVTAAPSTDPGPALDVVRSAAQDRRRVHITYRSGSEGEVTERTIDPEHVFFAQGNWYVVAWDDRSDDERMFRVDRIGAADPIDEAFVPRGLEGPGRSLYTPTGEDVAVRLRLAPEARWVAEYYEVEAVSEAGDGATEVLLPTAHPELVADLVLRAGGAIRVLDPPAVRDVVRARAEAISERYR
jgi:proteasome accessory factor C